MSAFIASSDTTVNVELDTLVDSIVIVVDMVSETVVVDDEDSEMDVVEVSADVEDEWVEVSQPIWVWDSLKGCRFSFSFTLI